MDCCPHDKFSESMFKKRSFSLQPKWQRHPKLHAAAVGHFPRSASTGPGMCHVVHPVPEAKVSFPPKRHIKESSIQKHVTPYYIYSTVI